MQRFTLQVKKKSIVYNFLCLFLISQKLYRSSVSNTGSTTCCVLLLSLGIIWHEAAYMLFFGSPFSCYDHQKNWASTFQKKLEPKMGHPLGKTRAVISLNMFYQQTHFLATTHQGLNFENFGVRNHVAINSNFTVLKICLVVINITESL